MLLFPNCKINLGLNIIRKREDGYHDLETVFYPVPWQDALEGIIPAANQEQTLIFSSTGLPIEGNPENNLCAKAYQLIKKDYPRIPGLHLHLHKIIPMGAGLGGGSADGAFTLILLNKIFRLGLSAQQLAGYALQLGSDCPFFIENKPCLASGRGEILEEIKLDLSGYRFVMVHPPVHVSTAKAFAGIKPQKPEKPISEIIRQPINTWKNQLVNDFEAAIARDYPEISQIRDTLYQKGALYAAMSGSGSTVFGIFEKQPSLNFHFPASYRIFQTN